MKLLILYIAIIFYLKMLFHFNKIGFVPGRQTLSPFGPDFGVLLHPLARPAHMYTPNWPCSFVVRREAALAVILIKGGLELNAGQLRRLSGAVSRLALLPCIAEAVAVGVAAHYILPDFSWEWGLILGWAHWVWNYELDHVQMWKTAQRLQVLVVKRRIGLPVAYPRGGRTLNNDLNNLKYFKIKYYIFWFKRT